MQLFLEGALELVLSVVAFSPLLLAAAAVVAGVLWIAGTKQAAKATMRWSLYILGVPALFSLWMLASMQK